MQDPAARIHFRISRERELQSLREQVNHLLPALSREASDARPFASNRAIVFGLHDSGVWH
jgi:hypothetical protein